MALRCAGGHRDHGYSPGVGTPQSTSRRRPAIALAALLVALVAVATMAGGSVYRWCIPLERVMVTCCCEHDERAGDEPTVRRICCEERAVDALPMASTDRDEPFSATGIGPQPERHRVAEGAAVASRVSGGPGAARAPPARPPALRRTLAMIQVYRC